MFAFSFQQVSILPTLNALQHDFHATTEWSTWVVSGFLVFAAVIAPLLGKLGDQFGRKPVLQVAMAIFAAGSLGAALAPDMWTLIAFRSLCGVAASFIPLGVSLISEQLRPHRVAGGVALISISAGISNVFGVLLGPVLAIVSWRLMFAVAAAGALVALGLSPRALSEPRVRQRAPLDTTGAALLMLALGALMLALTQARAWGWTSTGILALLALAVVSGAAFTAVELRVELPIVALRLFVRRTVVLTNVATLLGGYATFASLTLVSRLVASPRGLDPSVARLVHYGFGASSVVVGFYLALPMAAGAVGGLLVAPIARRIGWKWPLVLAMGVFALGLLGLGRWHGRPWQVELAMVVVGLGITMVGPTSSKLIADAVEPHERGIATGLSSVSYAFGAAIGAQASAAILTSRTIGASAVPVGSAYTTCIYVAGAAAALAIPLAFFAMPRRSEPLLASEPATSSV